MIIAYIIKSKSNKLWGRGVECESDEVDKMRDFQEMNLKMSLKWKKDEIGEVSWTSIETFDNHDEFKEYIKTNAETPRKTN